MQSMRRQEGNKRHTAEELDSIRSQLEQLDELQSKQPKQPHHGRNGKQMRSDRGSSLDLRNFERDALHLIETGGYLDALTQLERLRTLIDEICRKLRVKVQRHGPGPRRPKSGEKRSSTATSSSGMAGDGPLPEVFEKLSRPRANPAKTRLEEKENVQKHSHKSQNAGVKGKISADGIPCGRSSEPVTATNGDAGAVFTPWSEEISSPSAGNGVDRQHLRQGSANAREDMTVHFKLTHAEGKLRKVEAELEKQKEQSRTLRDEAKRLARGNDQRDNKIAAQRETIRTLQRDARLKQQEDERAELVAASSDDKQTLEVELRKRAAIVTQQEVALEKANAKNKALECKVRLLTEQQKRAMSLAKEAESSVGADAGRLLSIEAKAAALRQKLRATEEALQFTTDELEAREVEVAQLRVHAAEADEKVASWQTQKDDIDRKIQHSSIALRNVLKDKEAVQSELQRQLQRAELAHQQQIGGLISEIDGLQRQLKAASSTASHGDWLCSSSSENHADTNHILTDSRPLASEREDPTATLMALSSDQEFHDDRPLSV